MKTSKPFSTISYNSKDFLTAKLNDLITRNILSFYCFIQHKKEEEDNQEHIHLFIVPNGTQDTDQIRPLLNELNVATNRIDKCMPFQKSNFKDWYLYALHDVDYLNSKNTTRKYHYNKNDLIVSDKMYLEDLILNNDILKSKKEYIFTQKILAGETTPTALINSGFITLSEFPRYNILYKNLVNTNITNEMMQQDTLTIRKLQCELIETKRELEELKKQALLPVKEDLDF